MRTWRFAALAAVVVAFAVLSTGCVTNMYPGGPSPAGVLFTDVTLPSQNLAVAVDPAARPVKSGQASATAFLGLIAMGDASIQEAMRSGGITKVHHVDHKIEHFLQAVFLRHTTVVYGE